MPNWPLSMTASAVCTPSTGETSLAEVPRPPSAGDPGGHYWPGAHRRPGFDPSPPPWPAAAAAALARPENHYRGPAQALRARRTGAAGYRFLIVLKIAGTEPTCADPISG